MNRNSFQAMSRCRRRDHSSKSGNKSETNPVIVIISVVIALIMAVSCGWFR